LPGLIIGIFTFFNMTWNVFVVFYHPTYFQSLKEKADRELRNAVLGEAVKHGMGEMKKNDVNDIEAASGKDPNWDEEHKTGEAGAALAAAAAPVPQSSGDWQMRTDEHSGTPYWVNLKTGEQSWDNPLA